MSHHHKHHEEEREEERREEREERREDREEREEEREERRGEGGYGREGYGRRYEGEEGGYGGRQGGGYGGEYDAPVTVHSTQVSQAQVRIDGIEHARTHETTYQRTEYGGAAGAALGAGVAMYERHEEKVDPQNAARHKLEEEIAGGLGVGAAGVGLYGHHQKENSEQTLEELETGHKKHSWF